MLKTQGLDFQYPNGPKWSFPDLEVAKGEALLILGKSGIGKTTLLHLLAGLLRPQQGSVLIQDQDIATLSERALDRFRGQHIGLILQQAHFVSSLTVEGNLKLTQYLAGMPKDSNQIHELLENLGLAGKQDKKCTQLSIGEQQRVTIARAMLNRPQLVLADEPTSALDDHHAHQVIDLLEQQAQEIGAALVVVTHDQRLKDRIGNHIELG